MSLDGYPFGPYNTDFSFSITPFRKTISGGSGDPSWPVLKPTDVSSYYAMSSLASYISLYSRYIVPYDTQMHLRLNARPDGSLSTANEIAQYISPMSKKVYEFPVSPSDEYIQSLSNNTLLINWNNLSAQATNINDPGINWLTGKTPGDSSSIDIANQKAIPLPLVQKGVFLTLNKTQEFIDLSTTIHTEILDLSKTLHTYTNKEIQDLSKRVSTIEHFLGTLATNIDNTTSNFYLGLNSNSAGIKKNESGNWNDISGSGLWRRLV